MPARTSSRAVSPQSVRAMPAAGAVGWHCWRQRMRGHFSSLRDAVNWPQRREAGRCAPCEAAAPLCGALGGPLAVRAAETTIYSIGTQSNKGVAPTYSGVAQGTDGNLYGTTHDGGPFNNCGTIFRATATGAITTLHFFDQTAGEG